MSHELCITTGVRPRLKVSARGHFAEFDIDDVSRPTASVRVDGGVGWVFMEGDDLRAVIDHLSMALAPAEMFDDAATEAAHDVEVAALATEDDAEVERWVAFAATLKRRLEMLLTADRNWSVLSHTDDAMLAAQSSPAVISAVLQRVLADLKAQR